MKFDKNALEGMVIMVVEDDYLNARLLKDVFEEAGAQATTVVGSLAEALELNFGAFNVAVLDVRLSDGESLELAEDLLQVDVGVLFHSGHADFRNESQFARAAFCPKPARPSQLIAAILSARQKIRGV